MVSSSTKVPHYAQNIILLHVGGVAILTLVINAPTTGWVVKKLGLAHQSDLQKNILVTVTKNLDKCVDENVTVLKMKRFFNQVEWKSVKNDINLVGIKKKLEKYSAVKIIGDDGKLIENEAEKELR